MVAHERLIKIPVPDFNEVIDNEITSESFCLCYQFNIDDSGYGRYGFDTEKAKDLLKNLFPDLYCYDDKIKTLVKKKSLDSQGLYFFENWEKIKAELDGYKLTIKKNEILARKGMAIKNCNEKPRLFEVYENGKLSSNVVDELISLDCGFFIVNNYMPQGGKCLIFIDSSHLDKIQLAAKNMDIKFDDLPSIDSLKAW